MFSGRATSLLFFKAVIFGQFKFNFRFNCILDANCVANNCKQNDRITSIEVGTMHRTITSVTFASENSMQKTHSNIICIADTSNGRNARTALHGEAGFFCGFFFLILLPNFRKIFFKFL